MTEKETPTTSSWDGLIDSYLKASELKTEPFKCFVKNASAGLNEKGKAQLILDVQAEGGRYKWDVNITNMRALKVLGVKTPVELLNHNVIFEKVKVQNPKTKEFVDSLHVIKVE